MLKKLLLGAVLSWVYAASFALWFAVCRSDSWSFQILRLPGVVPVALVGASWCAIVMSPLAAWALRTGTANLWRYGPLLWLIVALYIAAYGARGGIQGFLGIVLLSVIGLCALGMIPRSSS